LKSLIEIGHIKIDNFSKNPKKFSYFYFLTPKGISQKSNLTAAFLNRKMEEYRALKKEINAIQASHKI
jgi:hypothetical protein